MIDLFTEPINFPKGFDKKRLFYNELVFLFDQTFDKNDGLFTERMFFLKQTLFTRTYEFVEQTILHKGRFY